MSTSIITAAREPLHAVAEDGRGSLTARFREAWRDAVAGIIEAGRIIIEGKQTLAHGEFMDWVESDLRLGVQKAWILMVVAKHPVLSNSNHWVEFPPSWRTLYELSHIRPERMLELIESGDIHNAMTREDAFKLIPGNKQGAENRPIITAISTLIRRTTLIDQKSAVAALLDDPGDLDPSHLENVAAWLNEVAKDWRASAG